jgi:hypothetical protein
MNKFLFIANLFVMFLLISCNANPFTSSYSQYPDEIKLAYNSVEPLAQKTIKNWKKARVEEYIPTENIEVINEKENKLINIKGIETLQVTFKTSDNGALGPITVFIEKDTKKVLGIGGRK